MKSVLVPEEISIEELVESLGPKAIMHFDRGTRFLNYTHRSYPEPATDNTPIVRIGVFGSAFERARTNIFDDKRIEHLHC